jgi:heme exporter protein C
MLKQLHKTWWKILCVTLLTYTIIAGLLVPVPALYPTFETIRNVFFHVPCWFTMILLLAVSLWYSIKYVRTGLLIYDIAASQLANVAIVFGILGFITGMLWGNYTWGNLMSFLFNDVKILSAFIGLLIYLAYFVLRGSIDDEEKRAKVSGVYSIFAFVLMNVFFFVIPRLTDSLHPGNGGNPAFGSYDMNNMMRIVFYPAIFAYFTLGLWIASLKIRLRIIHYKINNIPVS